MWKLSGRLMFLTGIIHTIVGVILGYSAINEISHREYFNVIAQNINLEYHFWFIFCGLIIIMLGQLLHVFIQKTQEPAPKFLCYSIMTISIIGCILIPASGFWLFIPQALIILFPAKN